MMKQVKFRLIDYDLELGGILLDNGDIICGYCGELLKPEEFEIIQKREDWVDLSDMILGD